MYRMIFGISCLISIILLFFLYRVRKNSIAKLLIMGTVLVSFWLLMEALTDYVKAYEIIILFQKLKFISVIFIPPLYLLTSIKYAYINKKINYLYVFIFIIPLISMLSLITNFIPYQFLSDARIYYINNIPIFTYTSNAGFWVHTYYSYINILIACYIFMIRTIKSSRLYKRQSLFIFIGSILPIIVNFIFLTLNFTGNLIDFTPITTLLTLIVLYLGLFHFPKAVIVPFARELVIENIRDITIILDFNNRIIDLNPAAAKFIKTYGNMNKGEEINLIGIDVKEALKFIPQLTAMNKEPDTKNDSVVTFSFDNKIFYYRIYQSSIYDSDKYEIGKIFMFHDVTQLQEYMNNLKYLNEELLISDRIIDTTIEGVLITDSKANITRVNSAFEKMSGYTKEEIIGKNPRVLKSNIHDREFYLKMWGELKGKGYWEGEIWDKRKNGDIYPKWMSITSLKQYEGKVENYIAISTDISKIKKTEEDLENLAFYDTLTGIPNRTSFYEMLEEALNRAKDNKKAVALLFMDLDDFKLINDSLGHAAGDLVLKEVAHRVKSAIYKQDALCRIGGDEFTVIVENIKKHDELISVAEAIIREVTQPYNLFNNEIILGISIGIALAPYDETTVEGLVRKADAAMYDAKQAGKSRYSFSSEDIEKRNHELLEMQVKLNKALINNEFRLYLQPQIIRTEEGFKVDGAEALIRWKTSEGQVITPDKFIPVCEGNGMIISIGDWVIEEIFRIDNILKDNGINIKLAINVSSKQLENGRALLKLKESFDANTEKNIDLAVEITESFLLQNIDDAIENLLEIKKFGVSIALDDFGTGFSSLSYLTKLPIDYLKIDKSFIDDITISNHKNLTSNIISMAKTIGLKTVAEGVETKEQIDLLTKEKCDVFQGYYFSKPIELEDFIGFVKKNEL